MVMDTIKEALLDRLLLQREIEDFLYHEAELLDDRKFDEWLDLMAEDVRYFMPLRRNVRYGEQDRENTSEKSDISWFDEGKPTLAGRVRQLNTGLHWAEEPLSRVCHMVSNVHVLSYADGVAEVQSRFLVYRNRLQEEQDFFVGKRHDVLRRVGDGWQVAKRTIILEQNVLLAKNITVFF